MYAMTTSETFRQNVKKSGMPISGAGLAIEAGVM